MLEKPSLKQKRFLQIPKNESAKNPCQTLCISQGYKHLGKDSQNSYGFDCLG